MPIVYLNGEYLEDDRAAIPISDRGFLLGDGVFETARLHRGHYFRLRQHLRRLQASAAHLRLELPPLDELAEIAHALARHNDFTEASLRITVTRGSGGRGLSRTGAGPNTVLVTLSALSANWYERAAQGWRIAVAATRRPTTTSIPAQLKGLGRIYALLAHFEAEELGADDALLLSAEGWVAEGPTWNVFWRRGPIIYTPSVEAGILQGVTRGLMLELAAAAGYKTEEGLYPPAQLDDADEIFATMTSAGVVPFSELNGRTLTDRSAAARLQNDYWSRVQSELGQKE